MSYASYSLRTKEPMRSPKRPFMVNDIVRLNRGWTPMTISWITPTGWVTAYYGIQDFHPDGETDPGCPTSFYTRHQSAFSWWDGEFIPGRNLPMARRFTANNRSSVDVGLFTGFTSTGLYILEFANNQVEVFAEAEITEIKPFSFNVRFQNNSTACFTFEDPNKRVSLTDVLITDTGDICTVVKVDVGAKAPKNFSGRRLITSEI